ncbi:hypothetical protein WDU94_012646 [Cyamophila willieti]
MYSNITPDDSIINKLPPSDGDVSSQRNDSSPSNSSSLKYINIISIFFGVMPLHTEEKTATSNYHVIDFIITFLYKIVCVYFCLHPIVFITNSNNERDLKMDWIWNLDKFHYTYIMTNVITFTILLIHTNKISKLGQIIKNLNIVENRLISCDVITKEDLQLLKRKEVKYFILVIVLCIMLILGSSIIMTHKYNADNPNKYFIIVQDFTHICAFCVELQFHALVMLVKHRLELVNNDLVRILHYQPPLGIVEPEKYCHDSYKYHKIYTIPSRLHTLTHIHNLLLTTCMKSNRMFQFQMLLDVFNTCVFLLVDIYAFMFQILYTNMSWFDMFNIWPIHHIIKLILIAYSGHVIKEIIYTTKDILSVARISTNEVSTTIQYFIQREIEVYLMVLNNSKFNSISLCQVLRRMNTTTEIIETVKCRKLQYLDHVMRNTERYNLQQILPGKINSSRGPGRRRISWLANLRRWLGMSSAGLFRDAVNKVRIAMLNANIRNG